MRFDLKLSTFASLVCLLGFASTSIAQTNSSVSGPIIIIDYYNPDIHPIALVRCVQTSDFTSPAGRPCAVTIQLEDQYGQTRDVTRSCTTNARGICLAWRGTPAALARTLDLSFLNPIDSYSAFISNVTPVDIVRTAQYPNCYSSTSIGRLPGSIHDSSTTEITKRGQVIERATTTYSEICVHPYAS